MTAPNTGRFGVSKLKTSLNELKKGDVRLIQSPQIDEYVEDESIRRVH